MLVVWTIFCEDWPIIGEVENAPIASNVKTCFHEQKYV
jgi:hypothetical protein